MTADDPVQEIQKLIDQFATQAEEEPGPLPRYPLLRDWVKSYLAGVIERRVRTDAGADSRAPLRWCASWWRHPEAVVRLKAIHEAWEALILDPAGGLSVWLRDHLDYHFGVLSGEFGPFARCTATSCADPVPPLPIADPPDDWILPFPD